MNREGMEKDGEMAERAERKETDMAFFVKEFLSVQKRRVACQLRLIALSKQVLTVEAEKGNEEAEKLLTTLQEAINKKRRFEKIVELVKPSINGLGKWDERTEWLYQRYRDMEQGIDETLAKKVAEYPVWNNWMSQVKGIGPHLAALIIGSFESACAEGETIEKHFKTVSQGWAYAGLNVVDGKAPKKERGMKISFNSELRSVLIGRVAASLLKQNGAYRKYYDEQKREYIARFAAEGRTILPASKLPKENNKRYESDAVISEGHLHQMALRKMVKMFVAHFLEESGVGGRAYVLDVLRHSHYIAPFRD